MNVTFDKLDSMINKYKENTGEYPAELMLTGDGWKILKESIPEEELVEFTDNEMVKQGLGIPGFDNKDWIVKMVYRDLKILTEFKE